MIEASGLSMRRQRHGPDAVQRHAQLALPNAPFV
jgi:hypothetical protein